MTVTQGKIVVGAIGGAFGVKGEVRLKSFCANPDTIADYVPLTTDRGHVFHQIILLGQTPNGLIARIDGILTKEDADRFKGAQLYTDRANLPSLNDEEYYYSDLIGLPVHDTGGTFLGRVKAVVNHGAGDILELHHEGQSKTIMLPFTQSAVPTVDLSAGKIIADPPDGLI